jgi:FixJ family two-component response regulator
MRMPESPSLVYVVDDDESVRVAVCNLLESVGLRSEGFESTERFISTTRPEVPSCLVLDVRLPGMSGMEFHEFLNKAAIQIPIIFITAHGDIPMVRRAMKAGAVEFLTKPFQKNDLLAAIRQSLDRDRARREEQTGMADLQSRFALLTSREREVMELVASGLLNKQVAAQLGLSEVTVKLHRRHIMEKMQATSLADLVRMSDRIKSGLRP